MKFWRCHLGTKLMLLAPMVRGRKGQHKEVFADIRKAGLIRARVDGEVVDIEQTPELSPRKNHTIEAVVDRIVIREGIRDRLTESIQLALSHGEGSVVVSHQAKSGPAGIWQDELYSTLNSCPNCKRSFEEIEPRTFSFNSPYGACPPVRWAWHSSRIRSRTGPARPIAVPGHRRHCRLERSFGDGD